MDRTAHDRARASIVESNPRACAEDYQRSVLHKVPDDHALL